MDIDEQTHQAEANNVDATVNDAEIASSSSGTLNPRSACETFLGSYTDGVEACSETISENVRSSRDTGNNSLEDHHSEEESDNLHVLFDEEAHQNEQHIENAGIDPNYPLVLVRRVSIPSFGDNSSEELEINENANAMEQENNVADDIINGSSPSDDMEMFNSISAVPSENEQDDDYDDMYDSWSEEDEDEVALLENQNFRGFANQLESIRNMIAHTRRNMAEAQASFESIPRSSIMQRFRRILFVLNNRRRRLIHMGLASNDFELDGNDEGAQTLNDNSGNVESNPNDVGNTMTLEQEELNENAVRFDTNLPAEHSYMGGNMNRVSGVNYFEADQLVKMRLFFHQHILFPGEVLPFMVDTSANIIEGHIDAQNGIIFGICFPCLSNKPFANGHVNGSTSDDKDELLYGVTCQIYELGEDNRSNTLIKSRALQRFVTKANDLTVPLEYINAQPRMKCFGFVKILPDVYLPDPLKCINMGSINRFRDNTSMQGMYKRFQAATTPWPVHVYETHNIYNIIEKARTQLAQHKIDTMPSDPTQLSYWLVRNLHLPEEMLKSVFLANTVNTRLKLIATTFKKETIFSCRKCTTHIADCRELFAMSKHGVQSQYCNSAGYIHETNTVYQINRQNILYSGSPSTEFSWFPGYQWHIILCKMCKHHLGWEFKAVEPNLVPKQFFGISSCSVRVRLAEESNDIASQHAVYINFLRLINAGINDLQDSRINIPHI